MGKVQRIDDLLLLLVGLLIVMCVLALVQTFGNQGRSQQMTITVEPQPDQGMSGCAATVLFIVGGGVFLVLSRLLGSLAL